MSCRDCEPHVEQPPTVTEPREDYDYVIDGFEEVRVAADLEVKEVLTLDMLRGPQHEDVIS